MGENKQMDSGQATARPGRATCSYPYFNMNRSLGVARAIHEEYGGSCTPDQLAKTLKYQTVRSGTFTTRTSAARQFGFIVSGNGKISTTERAHSILNPVKEEDAVSAKAEAFLSVALFNEIYQRYLGKTLPSGDGLKNLFMREYGLSNKRAEPAIRVFFESAEQAGFLSKTGERSRLVQPPIHAGTQSADKTQSIDKEQSEQSKTKSAGTGTSGARSAIMAILEVLPEHTTEMGKSQKQALIKVFEGMLDVCYPTKDSDDGK